MRRIARWNVLLSMCRTGAQFLLNFVDIFFFYCKQFITGRASLWSMTLKYQCTQFYIFVLLVKNFKYPFKCTQSRRTVNQYYTIWDSVVKRITNIVNITDPEVQAMLLPLMNFW